MDMIKVRIRENEKAETGKVFALDCEVSDLDGYYEKSQIEDWTEYGYRVWLQKAPAGKGRDWKKVETHLNTIGIPYTITEWEKGAESEAVAMAKTLKEEGISIAELRALIAERKNAA